jgi:hypothetical protein
MKTPRRMPSLISPLIPPTINAIITVSPMARSIATIEIQPNMRTVLM